jgi:hypothetical protein
VDRTAFPDPNVWTSKLTSDDKLRSRIIAITSSRDIYWRIRDDRTADGMAQLERLVAELDASPALAICESKHPGVTGHLEIRFILTGINHPGPGEQPGKIAADYGGTLADTALGQCVADEASRLLLRASLPTDISSGASYKRFDFPRPHTFPAVTPPPPAMAK